MNDPVKIALQNFFQENQVEPRRVFHGRGQFFPGYGHLCIDWYPPALFISAYQQVVNLPEIQGWVKDFDQYNQIVVVMLQQRHMLHKECADRNFSRQKSHKNSGRRKRTKI
ncbi:MAG: class I SAM-dependent methyltransferase [Gammaproteobacteria bacterium]|nr:class I SAM-dependent methyltransferase [Gammaproteobacteria bacterium]